MIAVRDARTEDLPRMVALLAGGAMTAKEDPSDLAPYATAFDAIAADPSAALMVADDDGEVVGVLQLFVLQHLQERGGRCAEIESVHVAADRRSQGIGAVLVEAAVERARAAGCYRVQLTSNLARPDAHRFYERLGFTPSHVGFKRYVR